MRISLVGKAMIDFPLLNGQRLENLNLTCGGIATVKKLGFHADLKRLV